MQWSFQDILTVLAMCGGCLCTGFAAGWTLRQILSHKPFIQEPLSNAIIKEVAALSKEEKRFLRALFDESQGRELYHYRKVYADALQKLENLKEYMKLIGKYYHLTPKGKEIARAYLQKRLQEGD